MANRNGARTIGQLALWALLGVSSLGVGASGAEEPRRLEFRGACYCRAAGHLDCVADLTKRECDKQCAEALCDDWFWLERRPCWNWGYGG